MAAYSAALISFITVDELKIPFQDFKELLRNGRYRMSIQAGTGQISYFEKSSNPMMRNVYHKLIHPHRKKFPRDIYEGLKALCSDSGLAFFAPELNVELYRPLLPCKIIRIPGTAIPAYLSMAITKGNPYKNILNYYTRLLVSNGVTERLYQLGFTERPKEETEYEELDLLAVMPLLSVLWAGILGSLLVFVVEMLVSRRRGATRNRRKYTRNAT
ncbi:glutamate receptor 1-like [Periplaneta americana]|uniref:glutamate receptor 1-like n=1 Tax=Periplaneta americana TaxID=6978 RepID=UPI0037E84C85